MNIDTQISKANVFIQTRNRFIAATGSRPPNDVYYDHPVLDAIALTLRYATRKRFKYEGMDQELRLNYSEGDAVQMLYCITRRGEDLLYLGRNHAQCRRDLESLIDGRRQNIQAIVDDERLTYGYCTRDMSDFAHQSVDIPFMRVAVMLIDPEPPQKGNHQHIYTHAWTNLRAAPPPEHSWLTQQIPWREFK